MRSNEWERILYLTTVVLIKSKLLYAILTITNNEGNLYVSNPSAIDQIMLPCAVFLGMYCISLYF